MANECHLGCGTRGYLGIIMPTDKYLALQRDDAAADDDDNGKLLAVAFQKPKPAATMNATQLQEERRALRDYCAMDTRLRNQITEAIAPQYYSELNKGELGIGCSIIGQQANIEGVLVEQIWDYIAIHCLQ
jgi:hypothetical protein